MTDQEKIQILLKEYDTLRAEALQRIGHRFAFLSLAGAVGGYSFFVTPSLSGYQILVLILSAFVLLGLWFYLGNLIARCAIRIAEIEEEINAMAGQKLLKWQHERRTKFFHKVHK